MAPAFIRLFSEQPQSNFPSDCQRSLQQLEVCACRPRILLRTAELNLGTTRGEKLIQYHSQLPTQRNLGKDVAEHHRADKHFTLVSVQQVTLIGITQLHNDLPPSRFAFQNILTLQLTYHGPGI